jgi:RHS repeat-associated protein
MARIRVTTIFVIVLTSSLHADGPTLVGSPGSRNVETDLATSFPYTDDPVVQHATPIRRIHIAELRNAVNAVRQEAGLASYGWADTQLIHVRASHVTELRTAISQAFVALRRPAPLWSDLVVPGAQVKARVFQEIRDATRWEASGTISANTTWPASGSPYVVVSNVSVSNGATLTIAPGTVVKFAPGTSLQVFGGSSLVADGTPQAPIVFTSIKDDSAAGDTNRDGSATTPSPGDWLTLGFGEGSQRAFGSLTNVRISYGTQLTVRYSTPTLRDLSSTSMNGDGLYLESPPAAYILERLTLTDNRRNLNLNNVPSSTTIRDSLIRKATELAINATSGTAATIENNSIDNNTGNAVITDGSAPLVLRRNSITNNRTSDGTARGIRATSCCVTVDARDNWWGSTTGPEIEGQSGTGGGGQVSSNVLYDPWIGKPWAEAFKAGDNPWTLKVGVGVDVATGNFFLVETDLAIATVGFPLEIVRTYNNKVAGSKINELGLGWTWNYGTHLQTNVESNGVIWDRPDGAQSYFKRNPDSTFSSEEGVYEKLTWNADSATYRMTRKDQSVLVFASDGKLSKQIDSSGNTTSITRDGSGRVTKVTEPLGRTLTFEYQGSYISRILDPIGRSISYSRESNGLITRVTKRDQFQAIFATMNYAYSSGGPWEMVQFDDSDGNHLTQTFESGTQRVVSQRYNDLAAITFSYDSPQPYATTVRDTHGRLRVFFHTPSNKVLRHQHERPNGAFDVEDEWRYVSYLSSSYTNLDGTTISVYDWSAGNLTQRTEPGGRVTAYTYDEFNNVVGRRDNLGRVTSFAYDSSQNLIREVDAMGAISQHAYLANGLRQSSTDALGRVTSFAYDEHGYPLTVTNPLGETTRFEYDAAGRKIAEINPLGHRTVYTYNGHDEVFEVTDPLGNRTSNTYDGYGRRIAVTDAEGRGTIFAYNQQNRLSRTTDANGGTVDCLYDGATGNLLVVVDPNGRTTSFTYDDMDRKTSETDALGRTWRYEYIGTNRLARTIDASGESTSRSYDAANNLSQLVFSDGSSVIYSYDGVGNRVGMTDWTGTTIWIYDPLNRIINVNRGHPDTAYGYDAVGNLSWIRAAAGKPVTYLYDAANRLKTVTDWDGRVTTYRYDVAGRMTGYTLPNNVVATHAYDNANQVASIDYTRGLSILATVDYFYDRVGNRTAKRRTDGLFESYGYDSLYRLTNVSYPSTRHTGYGYDRAGNRVVLSDGYGSGPTSTIYYTYDAADQLISVNGGTPLYDANGAQVYDGFSRSFFWNRQHKLSEISGNGTTAQFVYDGEGRRVRQSYSGVTTDYVVNTASRLPEVLTETVYGSTSHFIYGHDLLYTIEPSGPHYLHSDALGSTIYGTDYAGQQEAIHSYDVFGSDDGATWTHWTTRRFTGEENDPSGLIYLRARYYEPGTGRFVARDAAPFDLSNTQSLSRYAYVQNRPTVLLDPTGEIALWDDLAFFAAGAVSGLVSQAVSDHMLHQRSDWSTYLGAALGGGVSGWLTPYVASMPGGWALAGATGGVVGSITTQLVQRQRVSPTAVGLAAMEGALANWPMGHVGIARRGSSYATYKTVTKQLQNQSIHAIRSPRTAAKVFYGATIDGFGGSVFGGMVGSAVACYSGCVRYGW